METKREKLIRLIGDVNINWDVYMQVLRYYRWPQLIISKKDRVKKWHNFRDIVEKMLETINTVIKLCDNLEPEIITADESVKLDKIKQTMEAKKKGLEYEMARIDRVIELYNLEYLEYSDEPEIVASC